METAIARPDAMATDLELLDAQVLFTSQAPDDDTAIPSHLIDQAWRDGLWIHEEDRTRHHRRRDDDPGRIIVTSGTTGTSPAQALVETGLRRGR